MRKVKEYIGTGQPEVAHLPMRSFGQMGTAQMGAFMRACPDMGTGFPCKVRLNTRMQPFFSRDWEGTSRRPLK